MPIVDRILIKLAEIGAKKMIETGARKSNPNIDYFFSRIREVQPLNEGEDEIMRCIRAYQRPNPYQMWTEEDTIKALQECDSYNQNYNNRY